MIIKQVEVDAVEKDSEISFYREKAKEYGEPTPNNWKFINGRREKSFGLMIEDDKKRIEFIDFCSSFEVVKIKSTAVCSVKYLFETIVEEVDHGWVIVTVFRKSRDSDIFTFKVGA